MISISTKYGLFVVNTTKKSFIFVNNVYEINEGKAIEIKFIEDKDRSYGLFNEILKNHFKFIILKIMHNYIYIPF